MTTTEHELLEQYGQEAIDAYINLYGALDANDFEDKYQGKWPNDEAFVEDLLENCGDIPAELPAYVHIDWEWTAREVMADYSEENGYYFRNL